MVFCVAFDSIYLFSICNCLSWILNFKFLFSVGGLRSSYARECFDPAALDADFLSSRMGEGLSSKEAFDALIASKSDGNRPLAGLEPVNRLGWPRCVE